MPTKTNESRGLRRPSFWTEFTSLLFIEMTNWRWSWRSLLVTGAIAPLLSILGLGVFARDSGPLALSYVLSGNLVVSLMFGNMGNIQRHMTFLRFGGTLDYFATLPVRRYVLILAMVMTFLLLSLPSLLVTLLLGGLVLGVPLQPHPLILLVIPLCAIPLSGIGALIGASAKTPEVANSINLIVTLILTGLGPVIIPPDRLPDWMLGVGWLSPATYAASALRQALLGPVTGRMWLDIGVLGLVGVVILWVVTRRLDWRVSG